MKRSSNQATTTAKWKALRAALPVTLVSGCAVASVPVSSTTGPGATTTMSTTGPTGSTGPGGPTGTVGTGGNGREWVNVTSNLANMDSICGNMSFLSAKPDHDMLIAGIAQKGLWASTDGGGSWHQLGTGAGSAAIMNRASSITYDPASPARFWETGIYEGFGVYETRDDGLTFKQLGDVTHVDTVGIDFADPARKKLLAGSHERSRTLQESIDGGATWREIGSFLPEGQNCTFPFVITDQIHLIGCGGPFGSGGVLRTTDGAKTWTQVSMSGGGAPVMRAADGSLYWAAPVGKGLIRSTDQGQTWTEVTAPGILNPAPPIELPDGRLAALAQHAVAVSSDHGATWNKVTSQLPFNEEGGLTYSPHRQAFFVSHATCGTGSVPVPSDAIVRYDFAVSTTDEW